MHTPRLFVVALLAVGSVALVAQAPTAPPRGSGYRVPPKAIGATVRYVTLPHETHGYQARESVLHTVAEMLASADEWGGRAAPRPGTAR